MTKPPPSYYVEVSTTFTMNHVSIKNCWVAPTMAGLSDAAVRHAVVEDYCLDTGATFDTEAHDNAAGVTHMDRISTAKFNFANWDWLYWQCEIRWGI